MIGKFSIGCDPEYFGTRNGEFVAMIPFVEGTKDEPHPLPNGGTVMRDNVAVEFGIPPAHTVSSWVQNIEQTLKDMKDYLPGDIELLAIPSARFPRKELQHDEAKEFGCDPDFNAWSGAQNEPPEGCSTDTFRSCGGHIHIGYVNGSGNDFLNDDYGKMCVIRMCDCFHGTFSTILDNSKEAIARRKLYGKAGCYRPTDYGCEYRTLSNFWCRSKKLMRLMYFLTNDALTAVREKADEYIVELLGGAIEVQRVINEGDVKCAKTNLMLLKEHLSNDTMQTFKEILNAKRK